MLLIGKIKQKLHITFHNPNIGEDLIQELIKVMALVAKSTVEKEFMELSKDADVDVNNDNKIAETIKNENNKFTYVEDKAI